MVLNWRNSSSVKMWMYNQNNISYNEHQNFINSLNNNPNKLYFLLKEDNNYIGVIDFLIPPKELVKNDINLDNFAYIGLYANPALKGVGKNLMSAIIDYNRSYLKKSYLIAEVFSSNSRAIRLYQKFNFKKQKTKVVNGKKVDVFMLNTTVSF